MLPSQYVPAPSRINESILPLLESWKGRKSVSVSRKSSASMKSSSIHTQGVNQQSGNLDDKNSVKGDFWVDWDVKRIIDIL